MTPDLHDRSPESGDRARDDAAPISRMLAAIRWTYARTAADPDAQPEFERAVCDYTVAARERGQAVEYIIIDLKRELRSITPTDVQRARDLVELAVRACIKQYYEESV